MKAKAQAAWALIKQSAIEWSADDALRLSAALSYYTLFSLAPLLLLATGLAGLFLGEEAVHGELSKQLSFLLGEEGAKAVNDMVANANRPGHGIAATAAGVAALVLGATGVFTELKSALNKVFGATPQKSSGVWGFVRDKLLSLAMVASIGFLLLVSMLFNAAISFVSTHLTGLFSVPPVIVQVTYTIASLALTTLLFALVYKVLPDRDIRWRDVLIGALITAVLFTVGKVLIGIYLGSSTMLSTFGASASVVLILVWTYYSSLILFFGAEITDVWTKTRVRRQWNERKMAKKTAI